MIFGRKTRSKKNSRKVRKTLSKKNSMNGGFIRGGVDQFSISNGSQQVNNDIFNKCNVALKCN